MTPIDLIFRPWARPATTDTASLIPKSCEPFATSVAVSLEPLPAVIETFSPQSLQ
jgi:hypothetical protein